MNISAEWLRSRRWFAGKSRAIRDISVAGEAALSNEVVLTLLSVSYQDGGQDLYQLLLRDGQDAVDSPAVQRLLLELVAAGEPVGPVQFSHSAVVGAAEPRLLGAEQSNTSIAYGQSWILKLYRRLARGESRDLEVGRLLTEVRFPSTPAVAGAIEWDGMTLGVLQRFAPNQGDGWSWALAHMSSIAEMERLGEVTGELHAALASRPDLPDFAPAPASQADVDTWLADMRFQLASLPRRPERYERAVENLAAGLDPGGVRTIQIHGDYHLGQVLKTEDGFMIIDFEGEPARPLAQRRAKQPPLRDIAGMLRSFDYAEATAGVAGWAQTAGERFRAGWRRGSGGQFLAESEEATERLLTFFQLSKALYELNYERNNRPDWVHVPQRGIERLLERVL